MMRRQKITSPAAQKSFRICKAISNFKVNIIKSILLSVLKNPVSNTEVKPLRTTSIMKKGFFFSLIFFASLIFFCPVSIPRIRSAKANQAGGFLAYSIHIADELSVFDNGKTMATIVFR
jgi:hypothetical protein